MRKKVLNNMTNKKSKIDVFSENSYEGQSFADIELKNSQVENIEFVNCTFNHCDFNESIFRTCTFRDCVFSNCDLSLLRVDKSLFKNTEFKSCKALGINWSKASWGRKEITQLIKSIDFSKCVLNYSTFIGLELSHLNMQDCIAHEVDFSKAILRKANFKGTDLQNAIFRNSDLREANFVRAKNYSISPQLNKISRAKFSLPEVMSLLYNMDIVICEQFEDAD